MKISTYQSNQGEVFTGSQAALMKKYGITSHKGFTRPGGAPDANGDRWKLEGEVINKRKLFLCGTQQNHHKFVDKKTGNVTWTKKFTGSNLSLLYKDAVKFIKQGYKYVPGAILTEKEQLEFFQEQVELVAEVNREWDIIDNTESMSRYFFAEHKAELVTLSHYIDFPEFLPKRSWDRDISDKDYMNKLLMSALRYNPEKFTPQDTILMKKAIKYGESR